MNTNDIILLMVNIWTRLLWTQLNQANANNGDKGDSTTLVMAMMGTVIMIITYNDAHMQYTYLSFHFHSDPKTESVIWWTKWGGWIINLLRTFLRNFQTLIYFACDCQVLCFFARIKGHW